MSRRNLVDRIVGVYTSDNSWVRERISEILAPCTENEAAMSAEDRKPRSIEDVLDDEDRERLDEAREDGLDDEEGVDDAEQDD